jgi:spermidine synthase
MLLPALTIFLGAFLLFLVQPLMGKYLLPWFGGGPGVWTTCLLFFQTLLLGGYAYAHLLSTRVPLRRQAPVHLGLLLFSLAWLPIMPDAGWQPDDSSRPIARILLLLTACLGLPYLLLSATGPLVQRWFSLSHPRTSPYRLYALSNAGSLLALLAFPFFFEPLYTRAVLGWGWSAGFVVFAILCGVLAWQIRKLDATSPTATTPESLPPVEPAAPSAIDRLHWLVLPALASLLLVAVTNKICLDIAAVPFLWVLPLAVYLLTFILCFDHPRWYSRRVWSALLVAGCGASARCLHGSSIPLPVQAGVYVTTLLAACMVCHGELYRLRPAPTRLTGFYLTIAAGGAAGSMFVALLAPLLFADYREFQLGLVLVLYFTGIICLLYRSRSLAAGAVVGALAITFVVPALQADTGRGAGAWTGSWAMETYLFYRDHALVIAGATRAVVIALRDGWRVRTTTWRRRLAAVPLLLTVLLGAVFVLQARNDGTYVFATARNFYGAYKVHLYNGEDALGRCFLLSHGGITHGLQFSHADYIDRPITYYGATSGVGRALDTKAGERRVGLVGLGAGSLAAYGRPGDVFRFYEIDPAIVEVAQTHFSYLRRTSARVELALGDARLTLEEELRRGERQQFDVFILDAFSGDAIPVHLLTREAMAVYLSHLKPGGMIAVHISNRHLDLRPVVEGLARHHDLHFATINDSPAGERDWWIYETTWMLLSRDAASLQVDEIRRATQEPPDETAQYVDWTDDHASLFSILK